jgi:DNA-binding LytR/AlgR family response regulator
VPAVIADDEPLLRAQLRARLARIWPELDVVHEMENGKGVDASSATTSRRSSSSTSTCPA